MLPTDQPNHHLTDFALGTLGVVVSQVLTWLADRMESFDTAIATLTHLAGLFSAVLVCMLLGFRWKNRRPEGAPRRRPHKTQEEIDDDLPFR